MKNIIIVTHQMNLGGTEKALLAMLNIIPKDQYRITVLVMYKGGELPDYYVINNIRAKSKVCFIHSDVENLLDTNPICIKKIT